MAAATIRNEFSLPDRCPSASDGRVFQERREEAKHFFRHAMTNLLRGKSRFARVRAGHNVNHLVQLQARHRGKTAEDMQPVKRVGGYRENPQAKWAGERPITLARGQARIASRADRALLDEVRDTADRGVRPAFYREKRSGVRMVAQEGLHAGQLPTHPVGHALHGETVSA